MINDGSMEWTHRRAIRIEMLSNQATHHSSTKYFISPPGTYLEPLVHVIHRSLAPHFFSLNTFSDSKIAQKQCCHYGIWKDEIRDLHSENDIFELAHNRTLRARVGRGNRPFYVPGNRLSQIRLRCTCRWPKSLTFSVYFELVNIIALKRVYKYKLEDVKIFV